MSKHVKGVICSGGHTVVRGRVLQKRVGKLGFLAHRGDALNDTSSCVCACVCCPSTFVFEEENMKRQLEYHFNAQFRMRDHIEVQDE